MSGTTAANEISMRDFLRVVFKNQWLIILVVVLALGGTYVSINMTVPVYESSLKIQVSSARKTAAPFSTELESIRRAQPNVTQGEIIRGGVILEQVVRKLNLDQRDDEVRFYPRLKKYLQPVIDGIVDRARQVIKVVKAFIFGPGQESPEMSSFDAAVEKLALNTEVLQVQDSDVFYLTISDYDPLIAQKIANTMVQEYILFDLGQQVLNLKTRFGDEHPRVLQVKDVMARIASAPAGIGPLELEGLGFATIKVLEEAKVPYKPVRPKQRLMYIIAGIVSLMGGLSLAFVLAAVDSFIKNPWEFEALTGLPVLASIPPIRKRQDIIRPLPLIAGPSLKDLRSFDRVSDRLFMLSRDGKMKVFLMADINESNNSSLDAFVIASALANEYKVRTVLIDLDLRRALLGEALGYGPDTALNTVLAAESISGKIAFNRHGDLDVLCARKDDVKPLVHLTGKGLSEMMVRLRSEYQVVIVHASDLMSGQDALVAARLADTVIISLREDRIKREISVQVAGALNKAGVNVLGAVYNDRARPIPEGIYRNV